MGQKLKLSQPAVSLAVKNSISLFKAFVPDKIVVRFSLTIYPYSLGIGSIAEMIFFSLVILIKDRSASFTDGWRR